MKIEHEFDRILEGYHDEMCMELQKLLKEKTVASAPVKGAPFGEAVGSALFKIVELGKKKGFEYMDFDGYASEINLGNGSESVGIVSHIDVVPEGEGWTCDPFGGEIIDGRIYGRGAVDDKGPLIAAFYACLALKESGFTLQKKVKHIIGTDEETGRFDCIKYYKQHAEVPSCGIVPDSWFPAVYAEKGFVNYRFVREITNKDAGDITLLSMKGGDAYNIVAPEAYAEFRATAEGIKMLKEAFNAFVKEEKEASGEINDTGDGLQIRFQGKAAHASVPEDGVNAISALLRFLEGVTFYPEDLCSTIHHLANVIGHDSQGAGLGISYCDHTGHLTNNVGMISMDQNQLEVKLNLRCPVTTNMDDLYTQLTTVADQGAMRFDLVGYNPHYYIEPDNENLQMLVKIYREVTGETESKPKAHGGGSYARILDGFIPFGPSFQNEPLFFHKQDEYITRERLLLLSKIYVRALYELAK